MIGEANSNTEAVKKEMSDQAKSYCGIIDDKESIIAKVQYNIQCIYVCMYVRMYIAT